MKEHINTRFKDEYVDVVATALKNYCERSGKSISRAEFSDVVKGFNEYVFDYMMRTHSPCLLMSMLGKIHIVSRKPKVKMKGAKYNSGVFNNNDTNGYVCKFKYSNYYSFASFALRRIWSLTLAKALKTKVAKDFKANWMFYPAEVTHLQDEANKTEFKQYDEFEL